MAEIPSTIKKAVGQAVDTSKQLTDTARAAATRAVDASKQAVQGLSQNASDAARYLGEQGENAADAVSGGFKTAARSIRENAPEQGSMKDAAYGVAQQFSNAAGYLDEQGFGGLIDDIASAVKKSPLTALFVGISVGYLVGLTTRNRA